MSTHEVPKLIVFDLDYTLWPFWVDTHVDSPFRRQNNDIFDRHGQSVQLYKDVKESIIKLEKTYTLAVASRTQTPAKARDLLDKFELTRYFKYFEIYPGSKVKHFHNFKKDTGYQFKEMLFFDDEKRNIVEISKLGTTCIHVTNGVSDNVISYGLQEFKIKCRQQPITKYFQPKDT